MGDKESKPKDILPEPLEYDASMEGDINYPCKN